MASCYAGVWRARAETWRAADLIVDMLKMSARKKLVSSCRPYPYYSPSHCGARAGAGRRPCRRRAHRSGLSLAVYERAVRLFFMFTRFFQITPGWDLYISPRSARCAGGLPSTLTHTGTSGRGRFSKHMRPIVGKGAEVLALSVAPRHLHGPKRAVGAERWAWPGWSKAGDIVGLGGGSLEQPRQWLSGSGPVSPLGVPSQPELLGRPCGGTGAELGYC